MYRPRSCFVVATAAALLPLAPASGQSAGAKAKVRLLPSVESIVPGVPFDAALQFTLDDGWHIYWHNSGDSGMPPRVTWKLPEGFSVGDLRFPVPERHYDPGPIVTNILEGEPTFLIEIRPPPEIEADKVTIAADVLYLICAEQCIRETTQVQMELPVARPGTQPRPVNEDLFHKSRAALPKPASKYLQITANSAPKELVPGKPFEYAVTIDVADGYAIPAPSPGMAGLVGTDLFVRAVPGVFFDETKFPASTKVSLGSFGSVAAYRDDFTVRISGEVEDQAPGPFDFGGVLVFQPCELNGACLPVEAVEFRTGDAPKARAAGPAPASPDAIQPAAGSAVPQAESGGFEGLLRRFGIAGLLIGCFIYGLFINATPCVLPLLSVKVLGFVHQAHQSRGRTLALGLSFGAGVTVFFIVLGFLASRGTNVLQYPAAIIGLGAVVLALALSMLGVYTLQVPTAATKLEASLQKEGLGTSFGKGALAPVLGFACTAPFMAGMFGLAAKQPPTVAFLAFLFSGLGMAFPYMVLGANPHWLSFLPRPGHWMITFERIVGFLLLAMVIYLVHPLVNRIGVAGLEWTLVFYVFVAMACWVFGQVDLNMSAVRRWSFRGGAIALVLFAGGLIYEVIYPLDQARADEAEHYVRGAAVTADAVGPFCPIPPDLWNPHTAAQVVCNGDSDYVNFEHAFRELCRANFEAVWSGRIPWQRWSPEAVERAVEKGWIAFVDFTSDTCTICKSNKKVAVNTDAARERMKSLGVVPFQADFSNGDPEIFAFLQKFDRVGVPLNLIYSPHNPDQPIVLRTNLTKDYLLEKLAEAAADAPAVAGATGATLPAGQPVLP